VIPSPIRTGPSDAPDRQFGCLHYSECSLHAARANWAGWACTACGVRGHADRDRRAELAEIATSRPGSADPDTETRPASSPSASHRVTPERTPPPTRDGTLRDVLLRRLAKGPATLRELHGECGPCNSTLHYLVEHGLAIRVCRGVYALPGQSPLDVPPAVARAAHQEVVDERIAEVVARKAASVAPSPERIAEVAAAVEATRAAMELETPEPPAAPAEEETMEESVTKADKAETLRDLRREIEEHEAKLAELRECARLLALERLAEIEQERAEIAPLAGEAKPNPPPAPRQPPATGTIRERVLAVLRAAPGPMRAKEIEAEVGSCSSTLTEMVKAREIRRVERGLYRAA
jgi:hypothetical protein